MWPSLLLMGVPRRPALSQPAPAYVPDLSVRCAWNTVQASARVDKGSLNYGVHTTQTRFGCADPSSTEEKSGAPNNPCPSGKACPWPLGAPRTRTAGVALRRRRRTLNARGARARPSQKVVPLASGADRQADRAQTSSGANSARRSPSRSRTRRSRTSRTGMVRHANVQAPSARPGESRPVEAGVPEAATASNLDDLDDEALMAADFEEDEADNSGTDVGEQEDEQLAQALPGSPRRRKPSSRRRCRSPRTWRSARRESEPHAQRAQGRRLTMRRGERRPSARRRPRRQTLQQPSAPRLLCRQPRRSGGRSSSTLYLPTTT